MNAQTMAHRGFYDPDGRGEYAGCPLKFSNWGGELHFISYSTTVARVVNDRNGNKVTLLSDCTYSVTTGKHLSYISGASPYPVLLVPNCENDALYTFRRQLQYYQKIETEWTCGFKPEDFLRANVRYMLMHLLRMFDNYQERVGGLDELLPMRNAGMVANYERLCLAIENKTMSRKEALKQAKEGFVVAQEEQRQLEIAREKARKKAEAAYKRKMTIRRKAVEQQLGEARNNPDLLRFAYTWRSDLTEEQNMRRVMLQECLRKIHYDVNGYGEKAASFIWAQDDGLIHTSQGISCSMDVVKRLLHMWLNKQDIIGQPCDGYTVVMNTADYVKVGCHVIPTWNVRALAKQLNVA